MIGGMIGSPPLIGITAIVGTAANAAIGAGPIACPEAMASGLLEFELRAASPAMIVALISET